MKEAKLTKRQEQALALLLDHKYSLLYGSGRSGKTFLIVFFIVFRALKTKSRHVILRYRFSHVKQSVVYDTFPKVCEVFGINYSLNKSDWVAHFPNGSEVWFGGLDDKERTEKILGNEYSSIYINEASQISYNSHTILYTRLAQKSGLPLRYICDENPPSKSHWTYKLFIKGEDPENKVPIENHAEYCYLKMHISDNKENVADGYEDSLKHLPARQRKRFLDGDFAEEVMGALWTEEMIQKTRVKSSPEMRETIVSVDPSITSKATSDEVGIMVLGKGIDGRGYVLADESGIYTPKEWADKTVKLYNEWECNYIVAEVNQGGEMVKHTIKTSNPYVPVKMVHATKGKMLRAEPVSALYDDEMISHVGVYTDLEDEMTSYTGDIGEKSPNRLDAMVQGFNFLFPSKRDFEAFW